MPNFAIRSTYDPILLDYHLKEISNDGMILKYPGKRRILRKCYRIAKAAFLGVPILGFAIADLMSEVAITGTVKMTKKVSLLPLAVFVPAPVI